MKQISMKEEELAEREGDIFDLKLRLEGKEKTILQLMMKNENTESREEFIKNIEMNKSDVKIKVIKPKPRKL